MRQARISPSNQDFVKPKTLVAAVVMVLLCHSTECGCFLVLGPLYYLVGCED